MFSPIPVAKVRGTFWWCVVCGVVVELKACLTKEEMPTKHSYRPVRACGTRFVCQSCCS